MAENWNDTQPIYWQLRERTVGMILDGSLTAGDALPSVRNVAAEMQVNPITVSKAYQSLVDEGLVEKRRGLGMFVCEGARDQLMKTERERFLTDEWPAIIERIKQLDLDLADLLNNQNSKEN